MAATAQAYLSQRYIDWDIATAAGELLVAGHLDVYAQMPEAQMGPLSLLLAGLLPHPVYVGVVSLLFGAFAGLAFAGDRQPRLGHMVAALLLASIGYRFALNGHADDMLVLLGAAVMAVAGRRGREWLVVAGFVVAIAAKPTAVILLPLLLLTSRRALLVGVAGAALVWAPFALADLPAFLDAGRGVAPVRNGSLFVLLGFEDGEAFPAWVRPVQMVGCFAIVFALGRRGDWLAALTAAFAFRTLLEPAGYPSYALSVMAVALLLEVRTGKVPVASLLAWVCFWLTFPQNGPEVFGVLRVGALVAIMVVAVRSAVRGYERSCTAAPSHHGEYPERDAVAVDHRNTTAPQAW